MTKIKLLRELTMMVVSTLALVSSSFASADNSERFSFVGAASAFASATAPTSTDLTGDWVEIGTALAPGLIPRLPNIPVGYWPDGRVVISGQPGYFIDVMSFGSTTDSFGNDVITESETITGAETGILYDRAGPVVGVLTDTGAKFDPAGRSVGCTVTVNCRMVKSTGMLLCASTVIDPSNYPDADCSIYQPYAGIPTKYIGLMRASQ